MKKTKWFDRKFPSIEDVGILPYIIERLTGTPARLEEISFGLNNDFLCHKFQNKWSIKEHTGHFSDMEPLWLGRIEDFINNKTELRAADLTNSATHNANHNAADIVLLQKNFRLLRNEFVIKLNSLTEEQVFFSSLHPRLKIPMRPVDHAAFVAEHDDHHLLLIRELVKSMI